MAAPNGALRSCNAASAEDEAYDYQHHENMITKEEKFAASKKSGLFKIRVNIDLMQWFLTIVAFITRLWKLDSPRKIVFDELHYGKHIAMYMKRTYFFDIHPPLGKLLVAAMGYISNFNGEFVFDKIGSDYSADVPIWHLRLVPAVCGSLLVPVVYEIMVLLNLSCWSATIGASLILLDNSLLTQSRYMLIDAPLLLALLLCVMCGLKLCIYNRHAPFSTGWWTWLTLSGIALSCAISIRLVSFLTAFLVLFIIGKEFWRVLPYTEMSRFQLVKQLAALGWSLAVLPFLIYMTIFYVNLAVLNKSGPNDDVMSSAFQTSLEGGLEAITRGQPLEVAYGSQITLRNTRGQPCWLHSHSHVYPLKYPDDRGSSHQQQVTCYNFKDVNNWWIIKHPRRNSLAVDRATKAVKHGDIVQLIHGMTSRALNSHDVAAPMSPQCQEVSCYIDYNVSSEAQNLWKVEILNRDTEGSVWKTIISEVLLVHINSSQFLTSSGKQLPEWGFYQFEVVTDKALHHGRAVWNVEEHRYTQLAESDAQEIKKELRTTVALPLEPKKPACMGFSGKFWELQLKMLTSTYDYQLDHKFSSKPHEWPFLDTNIAYWINPTNNAQIHLLGNPVLWISGSCSVIVYCGLMIFYLLRRSRQCYDLSTEQWSFFKKGEIFLIGYFLHYIPYFMIEQTFFLYHYLPALLYKILLLSFLIEHLNSLIRSSLLGGIFKTLVFLWLCAVVHTFGIFLAFSYGNQPFTADNLTRLMWKDSWEFVLIQLK